MDTTLQFLHMLTQEFLSWYRAGGPGPYCLWSTGGIVFFSALFGIFYRPMCQLLEYIKFGNSDNLQMRR